YIYIVGCEENLFPSQRAMETPDGLEEERRLFYVALTRAKQSAMLSYCEMRFKWGNMEFSSPSRFLQEIDPRYLDCEEELLERPARQSEGMGGRMGNFSRGGFGGPQPARQRVEERRDGRTAIEELRRRFDVRFQQKRAEEGVKRQPDPKIVAPIQPRSTEGLRRVVTTTGGVATKSRYSAGQRVEHPKFGVGIIQRVDAAGEDNKLVIRFDSVGEKTLMEKFAKLEKL
ncbi:MAG: ATP-dependent DNA helicase, partial [Alistipes sp.]|nr:ATP-dependent DNA helicase [Alistipes sp.]